MGSSSLSTGKGAKPRENRPTSAPLWRSAYALALAYGQLLV